MPVKQSETNLNLVSKSLAPVSFLVGEAEPLYPPLTHHTSSSKYPLIDRKLLEAAIAYATSMGIAPGAVIMEVNRAQQRNSILSPWNWGIVTSFKRYELITENRCIQVSWIVGNDSSRVKTHTVEELVLVYPIPESEEHTYSFVKKQLEDRKPA